MPPIGLGPFVPDSPRASRSPRSREPVVQRVRRDVGSVRPHRRAELIEAHLGEERWIAKCLEYGAIEPLAHVVFAAHAVLEFDVEAVGMPGFDSNDAVHGMSVQGIDGYERGTLLGPGPIIPQLVPVGEGPFRDEDARSTRQSSAHYLQCLDAHDRLRLLVVGVKMRGWVLVEIHPDDDPVESAELRHGLKLTPTSRPGTRGLRRERW